MSQLASVSLSRQKVGVRRGNILCLDQYASIGGGQRSLLDLLPALSADGWDISAGIPGSGPLRDVLNAEGYRTFALPSKSYRSTKKSVLDFLKYAYEFPNLTSSIGQVVQGQQIDLLYVNGPRLLPHAAWVANRQNIPLVFHCHNRLFQASAAILAGEALRLTNAWVIASCRYAAEPIEEYVWPERLNVLYNGVRQIEIARPRLPSTAWRIGVIGRVEKEKGQLEFVEAAKLVAQKFPRCQFRVIGAPMFSGSGYYERVVSAAKDAPVKFIDWQRDVSKVYSELDLLVVPSNALEATTRVILEAFTAGIPVVAFPCGGIPEVLEDERTGFLTTGATSDALASRILAVLRMDRSQLKWVIAQARTEWAKRFSLETYRKGVAHVLTQALNEFRR